MKSKILYYISAVSFVAIVQLLFFWLIPIDSPEFISIYPFYTVLTIAHTAILFFVCNKYKYPASFAPSLAGSIITLIEIIVSIILGLFCDTTRTIIFVESMMVIMYILIIALLVGIASKESSNSEIDDTPIRPYTSNSNASVIDNPDSRRMPKAVNETDIT